MTVLATDLGQTLAAEFEESAAVKRRIIEERLGCVATIAAVLIYALRGGNKVLLFGNGGSAADSQHFAAELVGHFRRERAALPAIALTTDSSILTAIANDDGYDEVFARQVEALGRPGDVAIGITTSGRSASVLRALEKANELELVTVALTGEPGAGLATAVDFCFVVPSHSTARIQEAHITVAHAICELVEREFAYA